MGFFDGVAQENCCGDGSILFLRETHSFELMMGLGEGSKNFDEILSLKLLLIFAVEKGCRTINICGDSMNVVNWIKGTQMCRNLRLANILSSITTVLDSYDTFSCRHVYRGGNREADKASKEGLLLMLGQWNINE